MKVAVPLLQHSQWFGHLALSQTVCSLSSSSSERVREKVSDVGSVMRSHSGNLGRAGNFGSAVVMTRLTYTLSPELKDEDGSACALKGNRCASKSTVTAPVNWDNIPIEPCENTFVN